MGCCKYRNRAYKGSELKMLIGFEYIGENLTLDTIDFDVEYYCRGDEFMSQKFIKRGADKGGLFTESGQGGNEWYAPVDTTQLGTGDLMMKLTAYIPAQAGQIFGNDNKRTEIAICQTDVIIVE